MELEHNMGGRPRRREQAWLVHKESGEAFYFDSDEERAEALASGEFERPWNAARRHAPGDSLPSAESGSSGDVVSAEELQALDEAIAEQERERRAAADEVCPTLPEPPPGAVAERAKIEAAVVAWRERARDLYPSVVEKMTNDAPAKPRARRKRRAVPEGSVPIEDFLREARGVLALLRGRAMFIADGWAVLGLIRTQAMTRDRLLMWAELLVRAQEEHRRGLDRRRAYAEWEQTTGETVEQGKTEIIMTMHGPVTVPARWGDPQPYIWAKTRGVELVNWRWCLSTQHLSREHQAIAWALAQESPPASRANAIEAIKKMRGRAKALHR